MNHLSFQLKTWCTALKEFAMFLSFVIESLMWQHFHAGETSAFEKFRLGNMPMATEQKKASKPNRIRV